jgi:hypothetical protein
MIRAALVVAVVSLACARVVVAQLPAGYTETSPVARADSLREVLHGGRFVISVARVAASADERRLIERAESIVPPGDSVELAARRGTPQSTVVYHSHPSLSPPRWWLREWNGVMLPYALTGSAARYYIDRVRMLATSPNPFNAYEPGFEHRSSMEYTARVVRDGAKIEVHLRVAFSLTCGRLCGIGFAHSRIVEFDQGGAVVRVREIPSLVEVH